MGAFLLHRPLHSMVTCSCFPAVFLCRAEHRMLLRRVSVRCASVFISVFSDMLSILLFVMGM